MKEIESQILPLNKIKDRDKQDYYTLQEACMALNISYSTFLRRRKLYKVEPNREQLYSYEQLQTIMKQPKRKKRQQKIFSKRK